MGAKFCSVWISLIWFNSVWFGMAQLNLVGLGWVVFGRFRLGWAEVCLFCFILAESFSKIGEQEPDMLHEYLDKTT